MPESNEIKWRGIRPVNPEEDIPVKQSTPTNLKACVKSIEDTPFIVQQRPHKGVHTFAYGYATNGIVVLHTVPANTEHHLVGVHMYITGSGTGNAMAYITDASDITKSVLSFGLYSPTRSDISLLEFISSIIIPAGYKLKVRSYAANVTAILSTHYYPVSV